MIEKIRGIGGPEPIKKGELEKKAEKYKRESLKGESVEKSSTPLVEKAMEYVKRVEDVREELVEEIKRAMEAGKYIVDIEKVAKRMLGGK